MAIQYRATDVRAQTSGGGGTLAASLAAIGTALDDSCDLALAVTEIDA